MKAQDRTIENWLNEISLGRLAMPIFQRDEVWYPSIITGFLNSVIKGLPVGACLILEVGDKPQFTHKYFTGTTKTDTKVKELVLDGQQRLTALWKAIGDRYEDKTYVVDVKGESGEGISVVPISRWIHKKNGKRYPLWIDSPKDCWSEGKIPLIILNPKDQDGYFEWASVACEDNLVEKDKLVKKIVELRKKFSNFNIPYLVLSTETTRGVAIEVFTKMNTSYVKLDAFDILVAELENETQESLHKLVKDLVNDSTEIPGYIDTPDFTLSVAALLQDKLPNQSGYFDLNLKTLLSDWKKIMRGTKEMISLLEEQKIYDSERLPTETVLAPIAAVFAEMPDDPDKKGNTRLLLKRYLWRAFFTERYDRSIPSRILQDFRALRNLLKDSGTENEIPIFNQDNYPLPDKEQIRGAGWPRKKDRLARAVLLVSFQKGAKDFSDSSEISRKNVTGREYHHVYPVDFLERSGIPESERYRGLNCALITWKTNRVISAKRPLQYLLERCDASSLGEGEIRNRLSTHLIDYDLLKNEDYTKFLEKRAELVGDAAKKLCKGEAL